MHDLNKWRSVVGSPLLHPHEVHVWAWETGQVDLEAESLLSNDERSRLRRFHFAADRIRFLAARANLRITLGSYLSISPSRVLFTYSAYGKPSLSTKQGSLQFNLSHSQTTVVAAFTRESLVGIDIEHLRPIDLGVGKLVFSDDENSSLLSLSPEQREEAFFRCWTRKEAISKAEGQGMSLPMKEFSVSLRPDESPRIECTGGVLTRSWSLLDLPLHEGVVGALAMSESTFQVNCFTGPAVAPFG